MHLFLQARKAKQNTRQTHNERLCKDKTKKSFCIKYRTPQRLCTERLL